MNAADWNAKHPIGTTFIKPNLDSSRGHTISPMKESSHVGNYVDVKYEFGLQTYENMGRFLVISAYPGDMYEGKPLKKVRME